MLGNNENGMKEMLKRFKRLMERTGTEQGKIMHDGIQKERKGRKVQIEWRRNQNSERRILDIYWNVTMGILNILSTEQGKQMRRWEKVY